MLHFNLSKDLQFIPLWRISAKRKQHTSLPPFVSRRLAAREETLVGEGMNGLVGGDLGNVLLLFNSCH